MNNAKLTIENVNLEDEKPLDITASLRKREQDIVEVIEALEHIKSSNYWKVLENKVFKGIYHSLLARVVREEKSTEIYRLQGQITWAEKYLDLDKLIAQYRQELSGIRQKITN